MEKLENSVHGSSMRNALCDLRQGRGSSNSADENSDSLLIPGPACLGLLFRAVLVTWQGQYRSSRLLGGILPFMCHYLHGGHTPSSHQAEETVGRRAPGVTGVGLCCVSSSPQAGAARLRSRRCLSRFPCLSLDPSSSVFLLKNINTCMYIT